MIITSVAEYKGKEEQDDEGLMITSPINTIRAVLGADNFSEQLHRRMSSGSISLLKRHTSGLERVQEESLTILEQSMVAKGFIVTEQINPMEPETKLAFTSKTNFWIGVGFLWLMVTSWALIGPFTVNLSAKHPLIKASWRTQGNLILSIPIVIGVYYFKSPDVSFSRDVSLPIILGSATGALVGFVWAASLIVGCSMTLTAHADVMYTCTGVYILAYSVITWARVHKFEFLGYGIFAVGVLMMFLDPHARKTGAESQSYIGDLIPFIGAGFGAIQGYINHKASHLHPLVQMFHFFIFSFIFQLIFFPLVVQNPLFYTTDPEYGVFGWTANPENFFMVLGVVSPVTGILGNIGYFTAYIYWPMQIVAAAILTEPFIGQLVGILLGQDEVPGILTGLGLWVISIGFLVASYGVKLKQEGFMDEIMEHMNAIEGDSEFRSKSVSRN